MLFPLFNQQHESTESIQSDLVHLTEISLVFFIKHKQIKWEKADGCRDWRMCLHLIRSTLCCHCRLAGSQRSSFADTWGLLGSDLYLFSLLHQLTLNSIKLSAVLYMWYFYPMWHQVTVSKQWIVSCFVFVIFFILLDDIQLTFLKLSVAACCTVQGYCKDTVEFYFPSRNWSKNFWKRCIEHHAFFRCHTVKRATRPKSRVVSRGSSFRFGNTRIWLMALTTYWVIEYPVVFSCVTSMFFWFCFYSLSLIGLLLSYNDK